MGFISGISRVNLLISGVIMVIMVIIHQVQWDLMVFSELCWVINNLARIYE